METESRAAGAFRLASRDGVGAVELCALALLLVLVIVSPVPFGGVTPGEELRIVLLAFSAAILALIGGKGTAGRVAGTALTALFLLAGLGIVQVIKLEPSTLQSLSPASEAVWSAAETVLSAGGDGRPLPRRISIAPRETVRMWLLILAYAATFLTAAIVLRTRVLRRIALYTLTAVSVIHVVYAAATQGDDARLHGAFVNPNNFAGYLEIGLAVAFGLAWSEILTGRDSIRRAQSRSAVLEQRFVRLIPYTIAWAVIAIGIGLTKSRMGIAAAVLTMLLLATAALLHRSASRRRRKLALAVGGVIASAVIITAIATREVPFLRFLASDPRDPESDVRFRLWSLSLDAWRNYPWLGSGLGSYRDAFRAVQPPDFPGLYEQAHSEAIQMLVTGGAIGFAITAAGFLVLTGGLLRQWWRQKHREESAVALAAIGAIVSLLVHGLVEFNLSIPSIPIALAIVTGAGCAAARRTSSAKTEAESAE
jgi:O-antigen ligase